MNAFEVALRGPLGGEAMDIAFTAPPGITALFGRSGAGKSTVIAAVAGIFQPGWSQVTVGGVALSDTDRRLFVAAERRRVAVVFQQPRLFPHLSVAGNLRFAEARAQGASAVSRDEAERILGIEGLHARRVHTLSGGEAQRVAIARALLSAPRALLMDEPLSALDDERKRQILPMIAEIARRGVPVLYITHAIDEAAQIADTLVLLRNLTVVGCGPLASMTARADLPLAERDDAAAVLEGVVAGPVGLLTMIRAGGRDMIAAAAAKPGATVRVRVLAGDVVLATARPEAISVHNVLPGTVRAIRPLGPRALVEVGLDGGALLARLTLDAVDRLRLAPGVGVYALIKATSVAIIG